MAERGTTTHIAVPRSTTPGVRCKLRPPTRARSPTVAFMFGYYDEDIEPAITLIDRALALNPSFYRGWSLSGWLRMWAGHLDVAVEHWQTAIRLSPLYPNATHISWHRHRRLPGWPLGRGHRQISDRFGRVAGPTQHLQVSRGVLCACWTARRGATDRCASCGPSPRTYCPTSCSGENRSTASYGCRVCVSQSAETKVGEDDTLLGDHA